MNTSRCLVLTIVSFLTACASAPKPLQGQFSQITPRDSVTTAQQGTTVRWGGQIIQTKPTQGKTCFEMLGTPLSASGRPNPDQPDANDGRFIACRTGFYDPAVFKPGRAVTFIGKVVGVDQTRIGEYDYKLPKIDADVVYLWPIVQQVDVIPVYPYGPWGPYWGPYSPGPPGWWW